MCVYVYIYIYVLFCVCVCIFTHILHTHTYIYIYIHTHTCIHTHAQSDMTVTRPMKRQMKTGTVVLSNKWRGCLSHECSLSSWKHFKVSHTHCCVTMPDSASHYLTVPCARLRNVSHLILNRDIVKQPLETCSCFNDGFYKIEGPRALYPSGPYLDPQKLQVPSEDEGGTRDADLQPRCALRGALPSAGFRGFRGFRLEGLSTPSFF